MPESFFINPLHIQGILNYKTLKKMLNIKHFSWRLIIKEGDSSIVISQSNYVDPIYSLKLVGKKDKSDLLNETEMHNLCA